MLSESDADVPDEGQAGTGSGCGSKEAAADVFRLAADIAEAIGWQLRFETADGGSSASFDDGSVTISYEIHQPAKARHAVRILRLPHPETDELPAEPAAVILYEGGDSAAAIIWCEIHARWGVPDDLLQDAPPGGGTRQYSLDADAGGWSLTGPDGLDLGLWDCRLQGTLIARAHSAAFG